jgi:peptidylprolyl isomerase
VLFGATVVVVAAPANAADRPTFEGITVDGAVGEVPTLDFPTPFSTTKSLHRHVIRGAGEKSKKGQRATFDIAVFDGRTGKQLESSFGRAAQAVVLDPTQTFPGLVKGLTGVAAGSRVLIAMAPSEGLTQRLIKQGVEGVKKSDTLLFVIDLTSSHDVLKRARGEAVTPPEGLPTVKVAESGKPTIKTPDESAPTELVVQPLVIGAGPVVQAGDTIVVHYTGVLWGSDKTFDSSWKRGSPVEFQIGTGAVIAGWDEGLVGQTVGSQVLLVVPPDKGYGESGNASGGISGTDTLVFVVDVLDAY